MGEVLDGVPQPSGTREVLTTQPNFPPRVYVLIRKLRSNSDALTLLVSAEPPDKAAHGEFVAVYDLTEVKQQVITRTLA